MTIHLYSWKVQKFSVSGILWLTLNYLAYSPRNSSFIYLVANLNFLSKKCDEPPNIFIFEFSLIEKKGKEYKEGMKE